MRLKQWIHFKLNMKLYKSWDEGKDLYIFSYLEFWSFFLVYRFELFMSNQNTFLFLMGWIWFEKFLVDWMVCYWLKHWESSTSNTYNVNIYSVILKCSMFIICHYWYNQYIYFWYIHIESQIITHWVIHENLDDG